MNLDNKNVAILSGDTMLVKSYDFLTNVDQVIIKHVLATFNKSAILVCEGQQMDMDFETQKDVSIREYLKMIETSLYFNFANKISVSGKILLISIFLSLLSIALKSLR